MIGVVFLLAGLFKLMDPVGAGLVVEEYLKFIHLGFLMPAAKGLAVAMALLESLLGAAMISGVWRKPVALLTTALIVVFTILTAFLALFNPAMDCGCFGEVIHLTNIQTFLKNLALLALALVAFMPFKDFGKNRRRKYVSFSIVCASIIAFTVYSLFNLPLVDHTAFTPGSELIAAGDGDDLDEDDFVATFIYEKNGQEGAFLLENLPDSTWNFIRTETMRRNNPKAENKFPVLTFSDSTGTYQDDRAVHGNVLAISAYDPYKIKGGEWNLMAQTVEAAKANGFTPLLLLASTHEAFDSLAAIIPEARGKLAPAVYFADRKTLMSMNRSNGGATWFEDGELIQKFSFHKLPDGEQLLSMTGADPTESMLRTSTKRRLHFEGFLLYVFAILLIL